MSTEILVKELPIVDFWRNKLSQNQTYHPDDKLALKAESANESSLENQVMRYLESSIEFPPFELSILPSPYNGDLARAKVFILLLNPGLSLADYHIAPDKEFVEESLSIINQEGFDSKFPFSCLNPNFYYWSGFQYWHSRLKPLILEIKTQKGLSTYKEALSFVAKNIATVQFVAYHSSQFGSEHEKISKQLSSNQKILQDSVKELIERARRKEIILLVGRAFQKWKKLAEVPESAKYQDSIFINKHRSFHLNDEQLKAIIKFLLK